MRFLKYIAIISIIANIFGCANLQSKQTEEVAPFSAQGWGGTICREMMHDINPANGGKKAGQNIGLYQSWISGFISGINYARSDVYDISGATDPTESFDWVKQYCVQHPDHPIPMALHALISQWEQEGKILTKANE